MTWRDQIEAHTNAADMLAVWKHLKLSKKDQKSLQERDCLVLHLMSPMRRGRGGWCWLLYDDWNRQMALNN